MYSDSTQTLVLISSTILYHKAILTLKSPFCLKSNGILPLFVEDYEPNQNLKLFSTSFKLVFGHIPPPLLGGPHDMVFEHLNDLFSSRRFCKWFFPTILALFTYHTWTYICPSMHCTCPWSNLFPKHGQTICGVCPIFFGKTLCYLVNYTVCL